MDESRLLTPEDASEYLGGIPVATLTRWRHFREGPPFIKVGRAVRYRPGDLEAWLDSQTVEPANA